MKNGIKLIFGALIILGGLYFLTKPNTPQTSPPTQKVTAESAAKGVQEFVNTMEKQHDNSSSRPTTSQSQPQSKPAVQPATYSKKSNELQPIRWVDLSKKTEKHADEVKKEIPPPPKNLSSNPPKMVHKRKAKSSGKAEIKETKPKGISMVYINDIPISDSRIVSMLGNGPNARISFKTREELLYRLNQQTGLNPFALKELFPQEGNHWVIKGNVMYDENGEKILFLGLSDARKTSFRY